MRFLPPDIAALQWHMPPDAYEKLKRAIIDKRRSERGLG
jgi:hypothetical protein